MKKTQKNRVAEFIKHAVDTEAYGNSIIVEFKERFRKFYDELIDEIRKYPYISSKEKYEIIASHIDDCIFEYGSQIDDWLDEKLEEIVDSERDWLLDFMAATGVTYTVTKNLIDKVKYMPVAEYSSYLGTGDNALEKINQNINTSLKNAYITKESTDSIAERFELKYEKYENYFDTEITTFNTATFRNTDYQIYRNNSQRVRYSAVLDHRTCISCAEYHGMIFDITNAPTPPFHHNCRCQLVPADLFDDTEINSFSDWIETLEEAEKREYLGKGRYELYKSGIPVTSFVDNGRVLTLDELNNRSID